MPTFRKERMSEAIRRVVTEKLLREHSLIPQALVTINRVDVAPDYGLAKIFYSVFGDIGEREASAVMKGHQSEFRYEISRKLNLRRTPRVEFCFDKNIEYACKINKLLKSDQKLVTSIQ
jgi:ribosome-binding factor A